MNVLASRKSWILAPALFVAGFGFFVGCWAVMDPVALKANFDADGHSMVELMTLPLFAAIAPLVWLCCPVGGSMRRKAFWCFVFSFLAFMALVRELDWHKQWFAMIWPEISETFPGTVFKMRFLKSGMIPLVPKLFVCAFFAAFFAATVGPLLYFIRRLLKGLWKFHPVSWTMAAFGASGVAVQMCDRLPSFIRDKELVDPALMDKACGKLAALFTALEEGGEMMMAIFALIAILQAHAIYSPDSPESSFAKV